MRDPSFHGGRFVVGLALAIAMCMPACVAGEVDDEAEIEGPVAHAGATDTRAMAVDPAVDEERPAAVGEVQTEDPTASAPCAGPSHTGRVDMAAQRCRRLPHRPTADTLSDPPPVPWTK